MIHGVINVLIIIIITNHTLCPGKEQVGMPLGNVR